MDESPKDFYVLDEEVHFRIFTYNIVPAEFGVLRPVNSPVAFFVGGQPGCGKSNIQKRLREELERKEGKGSVMEIVGDDYRVYHPQYELLLETSDERAAYFTDIDSGRWVELAIELSRKKRVHSIIEGTLRRPEVTLATARSYRREHFGTELHLLAVHEFQSRLYIIRRYLMQVVGSGRGRYTVRSAHDAAYNVLERALSILVRKRVFDRIVIYNSERRVVEDVRAWNKAAGARLRKVFRTERRVCKIPKDELLFKISLYLALAKERGKEVCYADLLTLQADVLK